MKGHFSSFHNGKGIWNYASDSGEYHQEALNYLEVLKNKGVSAWWHKYPHHWHVKYLALMYWLIMPVPLSVAPLNAFLWAGCFVLVFLISFQLLNNTAKALIAASIFSFFPSHYIPSNTVF